MTIPPPDKTKAHQSYYVNGQRVPGVTTVLGHMAKPALKFWANKLGLQGIDVRKYVDDKADIGTCCHYMIECDVRGGEPDLSGFSANTIKSATAGFEKWLEFKKGIGWEFLIGSELQLSHPVILYGGTIDILASCSRLNTMIDIKTSGSGIYPDMECQVSAYAELARQNDFRIDKVMICRVGRDEDEGFESKSVSERDQLIYLEIFKRMRDVYELKKQVKWR